MCTGKARQEERCGRDPYDRSFKGGGSKDQTKWYQ